MLKLIPLSCLLCSHDTAHTELALYLSISIISAPLYQPTTASISLISTQYEGHSLDHKWHQPRCLTPAFDRDFVALLDIDGHFNSNDIPLGHLCLNEG